MIGLKEGPGGQTINSTSACLWSLHTGQGSSTYLSTFLSFTPHNRAGCWKFFTHVEPCGL